MNWVIGLLVIAYALVFFEALVPGGVLGLLGFACLVGASVAAHKEFGGWFAPAITFLLGGGGAIVLVFLELRWLEGSRLGKPFFLGKAVTGKSNKPVAPDDVVGKEAPKKPDAAKPSDRKARASTRAKSPALSPKTPSPFERVCGPCKQVHRTFEQCRRTLAHTGPDWKEDGQEQRHGIRVRCTVARAFPTGGRRVP